MKNLVVVVSALVTPHSWPSQDRPELAPSLLLEANSMSYVVHVSSENIQFIWNDLPVIGRLVLVLLHAVRACSGGYIEQRAT